MELIAHNSFTIMLPPSTLFLKGHIKEQFNQPSLEIDESPINCSFEGTIEN